MRPVFTISARGKLETQTVKEFLTDNFANFKLETIDSLFGFLEPCPLYGGRTYIKPQLSSRDVTWLYDQGIGVRLPLTNQYVSYAEYSKTRGLLDKYHRKGNSIIATNDELASWVKQDYPKYALEASVIKDISTPEGVDKALTIYNTVILPMWLSEAFPKLESFNHKDKITLFANAGCAYNCPNRLCYEVISRQNKFDGSFSTKEQVCSKPTHPRKAFGVVDFDLNALMQLGFKRFKLLRATPTGGTGF